MPTGTISSRSFDPSDFSQNNHSDLTVPSLLNASRRLIEVIQLLSKAQDIETITAIIRHEARYLTGADGASFILKDADQCYYVDEEAISPLWKGQRFPMERCVSGWVMHHGQTAIIEDIYKDSRVPTEAYKPTFVKSLVIVPIRSQNPIGAIGTYWATHHSPSNEEVAVLESLANTTCVAIENIDMISKLKKQARLLEDRQKKIDEQQKSLKVFTHALAHDLREPVRIVHFFIQMITEENLSKDVVALYYQHVKKASKRLGKMIDSIFDYTQIDGSSCLDRSLCFMNEAVETAKNNLAPLIALHQVQIKVESLNDAYINKNYAIQIFQNLISNAVKHAHRPVTIHIRSENHSEHNLFKVIDNGPGIAADKQEHIYEPFKRLAMDYDSVGLGLSICQKIINLYKGRLWCESTPGKGATFLFALPKPFVSTAGDHEF